MHHFPFRDSDTDEWYLTLGLVGGYYRSLLPEEAGPHNSDCIALDVIIEIPDPVAQYWRINVLVPMVTRFESEEQSIAIEVTKGHKSLE